MKEAAGLLRAARSPVVIAGGGVAMSRAHDEVTRLAEMLGAPIITSYERNDAIPNTHYLYVGALGRAGAAEATEASLQADVVLALGTRLSHFTTFYDHRYIPESARIIQVEIDQRELGRHYPVAVGILGDVGAVAGALGRGLSDAVPATEREARAHRVAKLRKKRQRRLEAEAELPGLPMKPQRVYAELRSALPADTALVFDAGGGPAYGYDRFGVLRARDHVRHVGPGLHRRCAASGHRRKDGFAEPTRGWHQRGRWLLHEPAGA